MSRSEWFTVFKPHPKPRARLFCFPYAGGSASIFRDWPAMLSPEIELVALRLPGHAGRYSEPLISDAEAVVSLLYPEMLRYLGAPYCLLGYSMGALLAYELASLLHERAEHSPQHLIVAARRAPHLPRTEPPMSELPDCELVEKLKLYDGASQDIFLNDELVRLLLPVWRADFALCEKYRHRVRPPLDCRVTAFGGRDDPDAPQQDMVAWRHCTTREFSFRMLDGGHFFLNASTAVLLAGINEVLTDVTRGDAANALFGWR